MYRTEYPRPNFIRNDWLCLNGTWTFNFHGEKEQTIEVPFVFQSEMSGIGDNRACDNVTYSREFCVPDEWAGRQIILLFGAVDYECRVYVNDKLAGTHQGGSAGFSFNITQLLNWSAEKLRVDVYDPCTDQTIPRGKQYWMDTPESIWYTRSTGIWQTVWLEPVAETSIKSLRFTPDIDSGTVEIEYELSGACNNTSLLFDISTNDKTVCKAEINVFNNKGKIAFDLFNNHIFCGMTHHMGWCWTPENPNLFFVDVTLSRAAEHLDHVQSYFGMRKIESRDGKIYLNNRPYIQKLILDQGYWPKSLMTAPDDNAFRQDITIAKDLGFNGCRKHQKAEDPRFLYWADKLGFLVWAEIPSCVSYDNQSAARTVQEWIEIAARDYNHPCIIAWVTLNESWGVPNIAFDKRQQSHSLALYYLMRSFDETRLVIGNDGWEITISDICAIHYYDHGDKNENDKIRYFSDAFSSLENIMQLNPGGRRVYSENYKYNGEPIMVTECGGVSLSVASESTSWGYTNAVDEKDFLKTYERIIDAFRLSPVLCGFCYTQLTDVEQEENGLLTVDRRAKVPIELIKKINDRYT